jgi:hypothetical protein
MYGSIGKYKEYVWKYKKYMEDYGNVQKYREYVWKYKEI